MKITAYFDGACEPVNPGGTATAGWKVLDGEGRAVRSGSKLVCEGQGATNNVAEWAAVEAAILAAKEVLGPGDQLQLLGDSALVVNQLAMRWKCNKDYLRAYRDRCLALLYGLDWTVQWIPREQNEDADELSKSVYIARTGRQPPTRIKQRRR